MRWLLAGIGLALAIVGLVVGGGYWWLSARAAALAAAPVQVPSDSVSARRDSASLREGERLAHLRGCFRCHGDSLAGRVFVDEPRVVRLTAPNVPVTIASYSDGDLTRLIRHGVTRTGRAVVAMPSAAYYHLSDDDTGRIIGYLRSLTERPSSLPPSELRFFTKLALVQGRVPTDAATMDHAAPRAGDSPMTSVATRGAYLARTICSECHGPDLRGLAPAPGLQTALGYTPGEFLSLMLDGRSRDGRDLGLMAQSARERFSHFTRGEIDTLYQWLRDFR